MTPTELRATLSRLGLAHSEAARLLGADGRTVRRWMEPPEASGHRDPPPMALRMLDLIEHVPGVRDRLGERS